MARILLNTVNACTELLKLIAGRNDNTDTFKNLAERSLAQLVALLLAPFIS
ncbi:hypothetical protein D3C80_2150300 [compost metagenome]